MIVPVKLVYASASADIVFRQQLSTHLHPHAQKALFTEWHEQLIPAGADAIQERHQAWHTADILVLLLSADYFLADTYDEHEIQQALDHSTSSICALVYLALYAAKQVILYRGGYISSLIKCCLYPNVL